MEGIIRLIMSLLAMLTSLYSLLIVIRIILTWFSHTRQSRLIQLLTDITDPYLDWWRNKLNLRIGTLDLSPVAAIAALSAVQKLCSLLAIQSRITLGSILAVFLFAVWEVVSFIIGFCFIVLILRFIAYILNSNMYSPFWRIVDTISQPLLYRINRMLFGNRLVRFMTGILASLAVLAAAWVAGNFIIKLLAGLLR
ncbi:MAG: YggT family protein [Treponema sp.]|nr:YggT family protein [Treponema sp.]